MCEILLLHVDPVCGGSFYDYYETSDGRYISVGSLEPQFFERLCTTLGGEDLMSQGAKQDPARQKAFKLRLDAIFKTKSLEQWQKVFSDKDVCVEPVLKFSEACKHEQIAHPIKMSLTKPIYRHVGVELGEHNEQILDELNIDGSFRDALLSSRGMG